MADDILALMQHCGLHRAAIIGHEQGARVATRFAKDHPQAVERLVSVQDLPEALSTGR